MVATSTRIGFVIENYRLVTAKDNAVYGNYGNLARESDDPVDCYFASINDAQERCDERQALLGQDRQLYTIISTDAEALLDLLGSSSVPRARFIDTEREVDINAIITEFSVDLDTQTATLKVWG